MLQFLNCATVIQGSPFNMVVLPQIAAATYYIE